MFNEDVNNMLVFGFQGHQDSWSDSVFQRHKWNWNFGTLCKCVFVAHLKTAVCKLRHVLMKLYFRRTGPSKMLHGGVKNNKGRQHIGSPQHFAYGDFLGTASF